MSLNMLGRPAQAVPADPKQLFAAANRVVVITGAGISADAGLATFRGPTGVASNDELVERLSSHHLKADREDVRSFVNGIVDGADRSEPTVAHIALADWQRSLRATGGDLTLVTMNLDGLHQRAGADTLELHGSARRIRCEGCARITTGTWSAAPCASCGASVRADVALYGERVMVEPEWRVKRALPDADLLLAIGTSVETSTIANWVRFCRRDYGVPTCLFSLDPSVSAAAQFDLVVDRRANDLVDYIPN